jgi:thiamine-phosphate pyrophosphorylase
MDETIYRILDANINRCREGLRVVEDYFRFLKNDPKISLKIKHLRHRLRVISDSFGARNLLSARESDRDVAKYFASPSLEHKVNPTDVLSANFKRIQESLRVIEEYSIGISSDSAASAGEMRFEIYQLEKEVFADSAASRFDKVNLYLLIGSDVCEESKIEELSEKLLIAGVDCLQLREKKLSDDRKVSLGRRLSAICRKHGKNFVVNDRADIAFLCQADGVHVGQDDLSVQDVRWIVGSDKLIGVSTHNHSQLEKAVETNPTYIAIGPAFDTVTKPYEPTAGLEYIESSVGVLQERSIHHVAIGGITLENLPRLISIGVKRIALCNAILKASDPVQAVRQFKRTLGTTVQNGVVD